MYLSQELEWLHMEEQQSESAVTGSEGMGTDVLRVRVEQRVTISTVLSVRRVLEIPKQPQRVLKRDTTSQKREAQRLVFETWPGFRSFRIWKCSILVCKKTSHSITGAKLQRNFEVFAF